MLAKTKTLISCAVTAQLNCAIVFAYAKFRFSHDAAQEYNEALTDFTLKFPKFSDFEQSFLTITSCLPKLETVLQAMYTLIREAQSNLGLHSVRQDQSSPKHRMIRFSMSSLA